MRFVFAAKTDYSYKCHEQLCPSTCACLYVQDFFYEPVVGLSRSPLGFVVGVYKVSDVVDQKTFFRQSRLTNWATGCKCFALTPPLHSVRYCRHTSSLPRFPVTYP